MKPQLLLQQVTRLTLIALLITACGGVTNQSKTGFVEIDGINVYYETKGEGSPLVLIHGGGMDRRMWDDQFEVFAEHFKVIRYDLPGFGKSDPPASEFSNIEILSGLLAALNIDQAHFLGLSVGGRIAIDYALEYPQHVRSLILVAPGLSGYQFSAEQVERMSEIIVIGAQEGADKAAEKWLEDPYIAPAMENPACSERVREIVMDNAESLVRPFQEQFPANPATTRLSEIKAPTLIVVGDRDVNDIYEIVDMLDAGIVNSQKEVIPGSGHLVNMDNRDEFNRIVLDFLMSLNP